MSDTETLRRPWTVKGETGDWEIVCGLEVHAQVTANSKLFSGAATAFGAEPNSQVSLVDAAMPGMLPVLNGECVRQAVRTGLALGAQINKWSRFDRKNYFYADLPQGYQISQLYHPIVGEGSLAIETEDGEKSVVGIERIHLEQDAGKSVHDLNPTMSYVDLNRSGCALMEIVSKPDIRSPAEAGAYVAALRQLLRYVGSCDGNMDEGSMRADVNVSVRRPGEPFGTRTETKNVNSVRFIMAAVEHEAKRQVEILESGGTIVQETRLFDPGTGTTRSMRSKEDAHDYRYFPDPDLLPVEFDDAFVADCLASLPELPVAKRERYETALGLTPYDAAALTAEKATADYFEASLASLSKKTGKPEREVAKTLANWILSTDLAIAKRKSLVLSLENFNPTANTAVIASISSQVISLTAAKEIYPEIVDKVTINSSLDEAVGIVDAIIEAKGLRQVSDTGAIDAAIATILAANADKVEQYKAGKDALFGFFVGQTMKAMAGKANPAAVNERLKAALA